MPAYADLICQGCGSRDITLSMRLDRKGCRPYFDIECDDCGCQSHRLDCPEVAGAVEQWIEKNPEVKSWLDSGR